MEALEKIDQELVLESDIVDWDLLMVSGMLGLDFDFPHVHQVSIKQKNTNNHSIIQRFLACIAG